MKQGIIFVLEDYSSLLYHIKDAIENSGESVFRSVEVHGCTNISDANDFYSAHKDQIVCLVCDSNMASIGLPQNLVVKSDKGLYAGWLWLCEIVLSDNKLMMEKSIMYTAYFDELKQFIKDNDIYQDIGKKVCIIRKKSVTSYDDDELLEKIRDVLTRSNL